MLKRLESLWTLGAHGQPPRRVRQIVLANRVAVFAAAATLPYQLFYLLTDPRRYLPVLVINLLCAACYLSALPLNRAGRFDLACAMVLVTVYVHLFVVTLLISTGAGVHLFYLSIGASLGVLFVTTRRPISIGFMALAAVLFVVCEFAFPAGQTLLEVPGTARSVMYAGSAAGAVFLAGGFSFLFRLEIDRAERALTRSNEELERLSGLDPLTGLANRRTLDTYLTREWGRLRRHRQPVAVLLCDVDAFKAFNDCYGHQAGDACLRQVAGILASTVRRTSDLAARYGGEEFVLVLPATDLDGAMRVGEQVRALVAALGIAHDRSEVAPVVTISIGVACAGGDELAEPGVVLTWADEALYVAKRSGRNRVVNRSASIVS